MESSASQPLVQVAAWVPVDIADALKVLAARGERSLAAEVRLALRSWIAQSDHDDVLAAA